MPDFRFDVKYKIDGKVNPKTQKHEFIGEYGWQLKWSESDLGFKLENPHWKTVTGKIAIMYRDSSPSKNIHQKTRIIFLDFF